MHAFMAEIFQFPLLLIELATGAMGFSSSTFSKVATSPATHAAALIIAFLAGMSEMLGQSVILVVNRVALYRFIASLFFTGATYVLTALIWAGAALAVAPFTQVEGLSLADAAGVISIVSLAFAPRLFGVFSIAPYFGVALGNFLEAWAMTLAIYGLMVAYDLPLGAAAFCGTAGWVVSYFSRSFFGHAMAKPLSKLRILVSGTPLDRTPQQIIDDFMHDLHQEKKS